MFVARFVVTANEIETLALSSVSSGNYCEIQRENQSENIAFSLIVATHVCNLSAKLYEGVLAVRNLLTPEAEMWMYRYFFSFKPFFINESCVNHKVNFSSMKFYLTSYCTLHTVQMHRRNEYAMKWVEDEMFDKIESTNSFEPFDMSLWDDIHENFEGFTVLLKIKPLWEVYELSFQFSSTRID